MNLAKWYWSIVWSRNISAVIENLIKLVNSLCIMNLEVKHKFYLDIYYCVLIQPYTWSLWILNCFVNWLQLMWSMVFQLLGSTTSYGVNEWMEFEHCRQVMNWIGTLLHIIIWAKRILFQVHLVIQYIFWVLIRESEIIYIVYICTCLYYYFFCLQ